MAAVGQRYAPPAHAAVICSLEAVFASAAGYVFLGESLTGVELCGCALMLTSSILAQAEGGDGVGEDDGGNVSTSAGVVGGGIGGVTNLCGHSCIVVGGGSQQYCLRRLAHSNNNSHSLRRLPDPLM